jgi:hypothetical protein
VWEDGRVGRSGKYMKIKAICYMVEEYMRRKVWDRGRSSGKG